MPDFTREEVIEKVNAGESLNRAGLSGANLRTADLYKADLRSANLSAAVASLAFIAQKHLSLEYGLVER